MKTEINILFVFALGDKDIYDESLRGPENGKGRTMNDICDTAVNTPANMRLKSPKNEKPHGESSRKRSCKLMVEGVSVVGFGILSFSRLTISMVMEHLTDAELKSVMDAPISFMNT